VTWGAVLRDARIAEHRVWWQLVAILVVVAGTVGALRVAASSIRDSSRRLGSSPSGTMAAVPTVRSAPTS
jgi:ABC-type dipeptide/oligopeptide/nickel transport system permease subunit